MLIIISFSSSLLLAQVSTIPFTKYNNHIVINVIINESKDTSKFIFDTGASTAVIDSSLANELGIRPFMEFSGYTANGYNTLVLGKKQNILIDKNLPDINVRPVVIPLSKISDKLGVKIEGIIGLDILREYVTAIDFNNQIITLYKSVKNTKINLKKYSKVRFRKKMMMPIPHFNAQITLDNNETIDGPVLFDTGAGLSLIVNTPYSSKHDLGSKIRNPSDITKMGLSSDMKLTTGSIKTLAFDKFSFNNVPIHLSNEKYGVTSSNKYLGILGADIISMFNLVIDYKQRHIYMDLNAVN